MLAQYEPSLASARAQPAFTVELPAELARLRFLRSLLRRCRSSAREHPLVLVLDDLQWADELSLSFLDSELAELCRANACS